MGASNDAREVEAWIKAGTGDDKTDILIIADAYDRGAIYSRDRNLTSNGNALPFGGADFRSTDKPGGIFADGGGTQLFLNPNLAAPTPHAFPNAVSDPQYIPTSANLASSPANRHSITPHFTIQTFNFSISQLSHQRFPPRIVKASMVRSRAICATNT